MMMLRCMMICDSELKAVTGTAAVTVTVTVTQ